MGQEEFPKYEILEKELVFEQEISDEEKVILKVIIDNFEGKVVDTWLKYKDYENDKEVKEFKKKQKHAKEVIEEVLNVGTTKVEFDYKNTEKLARIYPKNRFVKISFQGLSKIIKNFIIKNKCYDIDIKNCFPNILNQIMIKNGCKNQYLDDYCKDRENYFKKFGGKYNKDNFLKMINLEKLTGKNKSFYNEPEILNIHESIYSFIKTFTADKRIEKIKKIYMNKDKEFNKEASVLSYYLQTIENDILMYTIDFFEAKNVKIHCPMFDGCTIYKRTFKETMLEELNQYIFDKTGFQLNFVVKNIESPLDHIFSEEDFMKAKEELLKTKEEIKSKKLKEQEPLKIDKYGTKYYITRTGGIFCLNNDKVYYPFPENLKMNFIENEDIEEYKKIRRLTDREANEYNVLLLFSYEYKGFALYKEGDIYTGDHIVDAAHMFCKEYSKYFINCNETLFHLTDDNIWTYDEEIINRSIKNKISKIFNVKNHKNVEDVLKSIKNIVCLDNIDNNFLNKLDNYTGKLFFKNGVFDINDKTFINYEDSEEIYYISRKMDYDFIIKKTDKMKLAEKDILNRVIYPIFNVNPENENIEETNEYKSMKEVLSYLFGKVAGKQKEKYWLIMLGERNSGKGVIFDAFKKTFQKNVGYANSADFILKGDGESLDASERQLGFTAPYVETNIVFQSEIKEGKTIDGILIKMLNSGGDPIKYRQAYGKLQEGNVKAGSVFSLNDFKAITPLDTMDTMLYFKMPCYFSDKPEKGKDAIYRQKDDEVKGLISNEDYYNAFIRILSKFYVKEYPILINNTNEMRSDEDVKNIEDMLETNFLFDDVEEKMSSTEIVNVLKTLGISTSSKKIKNMIIKLGGIPDKNCGSRGTERGYKNIRRKPIQYDFNQE